MVGCAGGTTPWTAKPKPLGANGDIRIALIDVGEPAAGGFHLLVLSPPFGELGDRQCRIVTTDDGMPDECALTLDNGGPT